MYGVECYYQNIDSLSGWLCITGSGQPRDFTKLVYADIQDVLYVIMRKKHNSIYF